jgi:ABC-2 type transport system permease protein
VRVALVIAGRILRQRTRDRSALLFAVLTPLGLALAFSMLLPREFSTFHTRLAFVNLDGGPVAGEFTEKVLGSTGVTSVADIDTLGTAAEAAQAVRDGVAAVAIVIPAGFSAAVMSSEPTEIRLLGGDSAISLEVARSIVSSFASRVGAVQLMVATTVAAGGRPDAATIQEATIAAARPGPIAASQDRTEHLQASVGTFYGAAMAIMFVFFATQYGALALLEDRQLGTMARLLAAPIRPAWVVLGASLASFVLGIVSMSVLVIATTLLQGANWGPPPLVGLLIVAAVIAAMGISTVVSSVARTLQQAGGLNAIVAFSLAAIGGVFIPLSQAPESLVRIAQITPHAWFLRGIDALAGASPGLADIAPSVGILLLIGIVTGSVGLARARKALAPR